MTSPRYLLLNDRTGWLPGDMQQVELDPCAGGLRLQKLPGAQIPLADPDGTLGGHALPISLALDAGDRIYLLDGATQEIRRFDFCEGRFTTLPCIGGIGCAPRRFRDARAIAISGAGDLYVADAGNRRVQIFALKGLALRRILNDPNPKVPWLPVDVHIQPNCRILVVDNANNAIQVFDRNGRWLAAWTGHLHKPWRIAADDNGRLYVIQTGSPDIVVLDSNGVFIETISANNEGSGCLRPAALAFDADHHLHIASDITPSMTVVCLDDGGRRIHHTYAAGPAADLVFDKSGNAIIATANQVVQVPLQAIYPASGVFYTGTLDSRIYRCKWHRILLDADIPLGTRVTIDTLTAESEKTIADILTLPEERWSTHQRLNTTTGTEWDCLLDAPEGRYLWLRLTLEGEGQTTPLIRKVTLEYPRNTSRRFLPAVFSDDPLGKEFLDEFLAISDTIRNRTLNQVTNLYRYFDPMATPADDTGGTHDFLSWLGSWLGLALEQRWPIEKRRRLVAAANRLYKLRGTPEGLRQHILLYAGTEPGILEHFRLRRWLTVGETRLGAASELWGNHVVNRLQLNSGDRLDDAKLIDVNDPLRDPFWARAHRFTVFVPAFASWGDDEKAVLERIVEIAKPAHTLGTVELLRPRFRVGIQAFIGLETVVGCYPERTAVNETKLGYDSVLQDGDPGRPGLRTGMNARIGASTRLS
jgi:phage tail-like protein